MPRGKAVFKTTSPHHGDGDWPHEPETALTKIATDNDAEYIPGSLIFRPNLGLAEATFVTFEPGNAENHPPSKLHQLAAQLDAVEMCLYFDVDRWLDSL